MENFAQLLVYGQIQKIAVEFAFSAKTTATLPRARYNQPAPEQPTIRFCRI